MGHSTAPTGEREQRAWLADLCRYAAAHSNGRADLALGIILSESEMPSLEAVEVLGGLDQLEPEARAAACREYLAEQLRICTQAGLGRPAWILGLLERSARGR
jgi:hypothetical protein